MATFQKFHQKTYSALDPTSTVNSQVGKTILITGASSGIGRATAEAFAAAGASRIIIAARRADVLAEAVVKIEASKPASSTTTILSRQLDLASLSSIEELWVDLKENNIAVDVMVLSAAKAGRGSIQNNWKETWEYFETNVLGNLRLTDAFLAQGSEKGKVNISFVTL